MYAIQVGKKGRPKKQKISTTKFTVNTTYNDSVDNISTDEPYVIGLKVLSSEIDLAEWIGRH